LVAGGPFSASAFIEAHKPPASLRGGSERLDRCPGQMAERGWLRFPLAVG